MVIDPRVFGGSIGAAIAFLIIAYYGFKGGREEGLEKQAKKEVEK